MHYSGHRLTYASSNDQYSSFALLAQCQLLVCFLVKLFIFSIILYFLCAVSVLTNKVVYIDQ